MLVPATAEDLKKHGQISISPKTEGEEETSEAKDDAKAEENKEVLKNEETDGKKIQNFWSVLRFLINICNMRNLHKKLRSVCWCGWREELMSVGSKTKFEKYSL